MNKVVETAQDNTNDVGFYMDFFGFTERPFTLVPDPDFLFWSAQHRRAYSVLEFGILSRAPITLVTGGVGCGKTTLLRELLRQFEDRITVGLISNAQGGRGELIQWVLNSLGVPFDLGRADCQSMAGVAQGAERFAHARIDPMLAPAQLVEALAIQAYRLLDLPRVIEDPGETVAQRRADPAVGAG